MVKYQSTVLLLTSLIYQKRVLTWGRNSPRRRRRGRVCCAEYVL